MSANELQNPPDFAPSACVIVSLVSRAVKEGLLVMTAVRYCRCPNPSATDPPKSDHRRLCPKRAHNNLPPKQSTPLTKKHTHMPRVPHKAHAVGFPIYSLTFISPQTLVLGGGGGSSSKTGVKNKLALYDIAQEEISLKTTCELDSQDDCPMSLSVPFTVSIH